MVLNKGMSISDFVLYIGLVASFSTAMTDMFCNMCLDEYEPNGT
ncbi:MAG: hypothetical protein ACLUR5_11280 [Eubacterium ventriosum]